MQFLMMALHWIPLWFRSLYPLEAENVDSPLLSKPGIQKPAFYFHTYPLEKQRRAKNSFQMWKLRALLCVLEQVLSLSIPAIVTKEIPDFFSVRQFDQDISWQRRLTSFMIELSCHMSPHIFCFEIWDHLFMHRQPIQLPRTHT